MKIVVSLSALLSLMLASASFGGELEKTLTEATLHLLQVQGKNAGLIHALRWNKSGDCFVTRGFSEKDEQKIDSKTCDNVKDYIKTNFKTLKKEVLKGKNLVLPPYGPYGVLSLNKLKFQVDLFTVQTCDAHMKNCTSPKLSAPSELAKLLRESVSKELDRH